MYSLSISHAVKCKFILSNRFALSTAIAIEPLPKWVSIILSFSFAYLVKIQSYKSTGFCVGCMRSSLFFMFCCLIPAQVHLKRLTAVLKLVHANSQSAKSVSPLSLSQTIQQLLSKGIRLIKWFAPNIIWQIG